MKDIKVKISLIFRVVNTVIFNRLSELSLSENINGFSKIFILVLTNTTDKMKRATN